MQVDVSVEGARFRLRHCWRLDSSAASLQAVPPKCVLSWFEVNWLARNEAPMQTHWEPRVLSGSANSLDILLKIIIFPQQATPHLLESCMFLPQKLITLPTTIGMMDVVRSAIFFLQVS